MLRSHRSGFPGGYQSAEAISACRECLIDRDDRELRTDQLGLARGRQLVELSQRGAIHAVELVDVAKRLHEVEEGGQRVLGCSVDRVLRRLPPMFPSSPLPLLQLRPRARDTSHVGACQVGDQAGHDVEGADGEGEHGVQVVELL